MEVQHGLTLPSLPIKPFHPIMNHLSEPSWPAKLPAVFKELGFVSPPVMLAPLAGVSDYPFRQICREHGASIVYVEMLSAIALSYYSKNTMAMIHRHYDEDILGAQITAKDAEHMRAGITVLHRYPLDTIDINLGCPVKKVVKTGCGSALLRDPEQVHTVIKAACDHTDKIVSAKIRIGWSADEAYPLEVAEACEQAGARWLTVHGRLRSERYDAPVRLHEIRRIKQHVSIPVIGNGNLFSLEDITHMRLTTGVDGVMISRGALGHPWIFRRRGSTTHPNPASVSLTEWYDVVMRHLDLTAATYGCNLTPALRFRKHLLWYFKGWPISTDYRQRAQQICSLNEARQLLMDLRDHLHHAKCHERQLRRTQHTKWQDSTTPAEMPSTWDPKYDMHRRLDRGVDEDLAGTVSPATAGSIP